jgi:hypothetical protein
MTHISITSSRILTKAGGRRGRESDRDKSRDRNKERNRRKGDNGKERTN